MFERKIYKQYAKKQLEGRKKIPAMATLIAGLISILLTSTSSLSDSLGTGPLVTVIALLTIAINGILQTAQCHLYLEYFKTRDKLPFSEFLKGFSYWINGTLGALWYALWVFLWSLLFIIPGIVKAFSYSQIYFILAENPEIEISKAMKISRIMTKGFKGDLFVMVLSFIGWEILSCFTFEILQLWLTPYKKMSFANAYKNMKMQALRSGVLTAEDFN